MDNTSKIEKSAKRYYDKQEALQAAISALNTSHSLREVGRPVTENEARVQLLAVHNMVERKQEEVDTLRRALTDVHYCVTYSEFEDYLTVKGLTLP
jgi:hypothetical protein